MMLNGAILSTPQVGAVMQIRIELSQKADIGKVIELNLDVAYANPEMKYIDIVANDSDLKKLDLAGLKYSVIHEDLTAFYQSRYGEALSMGGYPTMDEAYDSLDLYNSLFPNIVSMRDSIGASIEGRPIYMVKLSDNVWDDEDEPEIMVNGLIHAREPGGLLFNLYFIRYLCDNYGSDPLATDLIDNREFYFIPLINPDGYEYNRINDPNGGGMWRKNRRNNGGGSYGVDLNRNWGYMWGYDDIGSSPDPDDETYRGTEAFSEPETQTLRDFINSRHFITALNFHSYSGDCLYPYGYDMSIVAEDLPLFRAMGDTMTSVNGYAYGSGPELLYLTNGESTDWQYGDRTYKPKIFAFVIEVGWGDDGFWPQLSRIQEINQENLDLALILAEISDNPYQIMPPNPPTLNPIGEILTDSFTISWSHSDPDNPATAYEIVEKTGYQRVVEGFESSQADWTLNGWSRSTQRKYECSYSLYSGYENSAHYTAILNTPIHVIIGDTISFYTWYNIESDYDYAYVQASTDGGIAFTNLEGNITTNDNPNGGNMGNGITGSSNNAWVVAKFPLADFVGEDIILRFLYATDNWSLEAGMYIDQLYPVDAFENSISLASDITQTSYLIDGRSTGDYYYQVRAKDAQNQWGSYSNLEVANVRLTGIDDSDSEIPRAFALRANYPNPFNATTIIKYELPIRTNVRLQVFNLRGEKVATLVDGNIPAGKHQVSWNAPRYSSGIYFYRLESGGRVFTKRMTLLK